MNRLSLPLADLKARYDVVVVGSGYGGGIAASRLARAGRSVCLLERGEERQPGEYPRTLADAAPQMQVDAPEHHTGSAVALFDFHVNRDINVLVGCGLGGTSLINANVSIRPEPRVFDDPRWPAEVQRDRTTRLEDGYTHAEAMLRPTPYPDAWPELPKTAAHRASAAGMDERFYKVPINVAFEDGVNHVGVEQHKCTLCGDCVTGCNYGAKNTTLMNYLPDAVNHGAEIFTQARVRRVERREHGWLVFFEPAADARQRFGAPPLSVMADVVVLSAGTLGSTEILFRSSAHGLPVSDRLGDRFSGNGDMLGFAHSARQRVSGIGFGPCEPGEVDPVGPCITSIIDIREQPDLEQGLIIEEGSLPGAMAPLLAGTFAAAGTIAVGHDGVAVDRAASQLANEARSLVGGAYTGAADRTQTFLIMSHDGGDGRMRLEDDRLRVDWPGVGTRDVFSRDDEKLRAASAAIGGVYVKNPTWTKALHHNVVTVHPLGGCVMAARADDGVTNHKGQVFASGSGTAVHEGLYVCDGAVVPRPLGVNPLLTISALAERACAYIAEDRGWTIDYAFTPVAARYRTLRTGLKFTEKMVGPFSTADVDSDESGAKRGKADRSSLEFVLTVATDDLDRMLADATHEAALHGTVVAPELSTKPMTVSGGVFNLFVNDDAKIHERNMRYRMKLHAEEGRTYYFEGKKRVQTGSLLKVWPATTTLYVKVHDGPDASGPIVGRGILRIRPADFARQLTTMQVTHAPDEATRARGLAAFGRLFAGELWANYGGLASHVLAPEMGSPAAAPSVRRTAAPPEVEPEVHVFPSADGVELRLVRYHGGDKGPLVCAPGFSNSSSVFSMDTVDENFADFFARRGYDTWLFDYRASPDLAASRTQFTIDDIAQHDWPAAVEYVRARTGRRDVQVVAHCMGAMSCFMALLDGMTGVRQFVASQLTPHPVVDRLGKIKSGFRLDSMLGALGAEGVTTDAGGSILARNIDRAIALYPMPEEWAGLGPVSRRMFAIYGPVFKPANLNRATHEALGEVFGFANLTAFAQISAMLHTGHILDAKGHNRYLPHVKRLAFPIVLLHGADNAFVLPEGSARTFQWLRENNDLSLYRRHLIAGYGHLDCFIGASAATDVFPVVLAELDEMNP